MSAFGAKADIAPPACVARRLLTHQHLHFAGARQPDSAGGRGGLTEAEIDKLYADE